MLGAGEFGTVWKGELDFGGQQLRPVAIKEARTTLDRHEIADFLAEFKIHWGLRRHNHVVNILGIAAATLPIQIVYAICDENLLQYVSRQDLSTLDNLNLLVDTSRGIKHLHQNHVLHRDIAARNVLIAGGWAKIADFGLSKQAPLGWIQLASKFSVLWAPPPEVFDNALFSFKSDVWSWGIMASEVLTQGATPYASLGIRNTEDVKRQVRLGAQTPLPQDIPAGLRDLLKKEVWLLDNNRRALINRVLNVVLLEKKTEETRLARLRQANQNRPG